MLITVKDTFSMFIIIFFSSLMWDLLKYFLQPHLSLFGPFTATHGCKFSTANNFLKLPHLRKVAVTTATWQHCWQSAMHWKAVCQGAIIVVTKPWRKYTYKKSLLSADVHARVFNSAKSLYFRMQWPTTVLVVPLFQTLLKLKRGVTLPQCDSNI
jgi:hypothetical protein